MAKSTKAAKAASKSAGKSRTNGHAGKGHARVASPKPRTSPRGHADAGQGNWATDLVFDVREPKLAVSLRLDADVLRFFRGFGSGYQTRINEVLKAFMHARSSIENGSAATTVPRLARSAAAQGSKRAR